ncbi:MAG: hypothetical protein HZA92_03565 [Verrucomicrobia bacterium]|nr:hypothetical protein [Verrucomicrobiota bacterium]
MDATTNLVPLDVPFAQSEHPSVSLITEQFGSSVIVVVAPHGTDQYPKHLVRFDKVLVALYYEEALGLRGKYPVVAGAQSSGCAYVWPDSPWLRASHGWAVDFLKWPDLRHYIIFGADDVVELLAAGAPRVERIDERCVIETKHEV